MVGFSVDCDDIWVDRSTVIMSIFMVLLQVHFSTNNFLGVRVRFYWH